MNNVVSNSHITLRSVAHCSLQMKSTTGAQNEHSEVRAQSATSKLKTDNVKPNSISVLLFKEHENGIVCSTVRDVHVNQ